MKSKCFFSNVLRAICMSLLVGAIFPTVPISATPPPPSMQATSALRRKPSEKKSRVTREMISEGQQRLFDLGYWIGNADGKWGEASRHGLIAFQKVEGRPLTGKLTRDELQALRDARRPSPRDHGYAHIEVDLTRQVLLVVDEDGTVSRILPVSTGNGKPYTLDDYTQPAVTPPGRFRVYRKVPGWRKSPLGLLYYPSYIVGGIAIHGNPAVPTQPQSHGCIRIPMFAAAELSDMTPIGTEVVVYNSSSLTRQSASR
jgi:N-acetylmuramoyl-L-alanine amidase